MRQIYKNGKIYTGEGSLCEAFLVENGIFTKVGTNHEMMSCKRIEDTVIDLKGKFVCAGFNDSHMHLVYFGYSLGMVDLSNHTGSLKEMKKTLKNFIRERKIKKGTWIRGRGWNQDYFTDEKRFPTCYDLDEVSKEHPIFITRACGHICVVNSKALEILGITAEAPDTVKQYCETDEDGIPNGIFREDAMDFVYKKLPAFSVNEVKTMILDAAKEVNRFGITSVQTDDFLAFPTVPAKVILKAFKELVREGRMTVRVNEQVQFSEFQEFQNFIKEGYVTGKGNEWFRIGPLKLVGDGSLGARSAFLSTPYADDPSTCGIARFSEQQLETIISYAHHHNMQAAIHAIGDGMLDRVLKVYEKVLKESPKKDHRHGIVHCQIMRPEQLKKMKELNLHAYIQSVFLDYDIHIVEKRVGRERAKSSYSFKTMHDTIHTSNGSDCPVEFPNVLAGIQCAVTRTTLKDHSRPYLPKQALTVREALDTFTSEGAHASFEEKVKGKIKEGMYADFVILDQNPLQEDPFAIKDIKICGTYVGGIQRYIAEEFVKDF